MNRTWKRFLAVALMSFMISSMTVSAKEPVVNEHIDSAMGTIASEICNFSLQDIELPSVRINGETVDLALPDVSIAKAVAFLTNFGGKTLSKTTYAIERATGNAEAEDPAAAYEDENGDFEMEIDGKAVGDAAKGAAKGYVGFFKRLSQGLNSDLNPIMDRLNDYEINENSLPYKMGGLDDKSRASESGEEQSEAPVEEETEQYIEGD